MWGYNQNCFRRPEFVADSAYLEALRRISLRKFLFVCVLIVACSFLAVAQENTKADFFGGYQWTNIDTGGVTDRLNFNGWNTAVTGYFSKSVGVTADFSGAYGDTLGVSTKLHTYMFGPTLRVPSDKLSPFVHALFGGVHVSGGGVSDSSFGYALGGGIDLGQKNFALRIAQFDYLGSRFGGENQKNFRYSAGVVFKF